MNIGRLKFHRLTQDQFARLKSEKRDQFNHRRYGLKDLAVIMSQEGVIHEQMRGGALVEKLIRDDRTRAERDAAREEYLFRMKLEFATRVAAVKRKSQKQSRNDGDGSDSMNPRQAQPQQKRSLPSWRLDMG